MSLWLSLSHLVKQRPTMQGEGHMELCERQGRKTLWVLVSISPYPQLYVSLGLGFSVNFCRAIKIAAPRLYADTLFLHGQCDSRPLR